MRYEWSKLADFDSLKEGDLVVGDDGIEREVTWIASNKRSIGMVPTERVQPTIDEIHEVVTTAMEDPHPTVRTS